MTAVILALAALACAVAILGCKVARIERHLARRPPGPDRTSGADDPAGVAQFDFDQAPGRPEADQPGQTWRNNVRANRDGRGYT